MAQQANGETGSALPEETQGDAAPLASVSETMPALSSMPPPQIEGHEVLRELGRGGQAVVYEAFQKSTHRTVAIKVMIEGAYASRASRRRFEREIDLAASLQHPNIVCVHEGGITADGRLYYVMDCVRGMPVTQYVRKKWMDITRTLELFADICDAVAHAHRKGVIHRDLKPSNVLVDAEGGVRILDFGLAKQVAETDQTAVSIAGQVLGTLPYMSPEQTKGNPDLIDVRTDVYALGVILYELLTGQYPYPVAGEIAEVLRHISQTAPRPLTRSWTKESGVAPASARRPGRCPIGEEVETIVLKALAKERERRYQSAGELANDVRHYLRGEPVEARRDSTIYILTKTLWRHRVSAGVAAAALILLGAVAVAMTVSRNRAVRAEQDALGQRDQANEARAAETIQRARAVEAAQEASAVLEFFRLHVLAAARPEGQPGGLGRDVTLRSAIDAAEKHIGPTFAERPLVEASIRQSLGSTYRELGDPARAVRQLERAAALRNAVLGSDHGQALQSLNSLAVTLLELGHFDRAIEALERIVAIHRTTSDPLLPTSMSSLAEAYRSAGRTQEAIRLLQEAIKRHHPEHDSPRSLSVRRASLLNSLANAYSDAGNTGKAFPLYEEALAWDLQHLGPQHLSTLTAMLNLGWAYRVAGRFDRAIALTEQAMAGSKSKFGEAYSVTLACMNNLAVCYQDAGRTNDAIAILRELLEALTAKYGANHPRTQQAALNLAGIYRLTGRFDEAVAVLAPRLAELRRLPGNDRFMCDILHHLSYCLLRQGRPDGAEPLLREFITFAQASSIGPWLADDGRSMLGRSLCEQGRYPEAEPLLLSGFEGLCRNADHIYAALRQHRLRESGEWIVQLYDRWGKTEEAMRWRNRLAVSECSGPP